ncbi:MAG: hypothetical protein H0V44_04295 [Planctomycetes bacterium]|nr:hypothetical protein [Planctomycetota bacterium]
MRAALRMMMYIAAMAIGTLLVANNFRPGVADVIVTFLKTEEGRLVASGIAVILMLSPMAIFLRWMQVMRRAREISYQTENGRISVNLIAVEEALTRAIEGEPEVKKAHVRVYEDRVKRTIIIESVMTLWEVPNVTDRNRFCQRLLRRRFAELMPEQTAVQVNLSVHRLTTRRADSHQTVLTPQSNAPSTAASTTALEKRARDGDEALYRDPLLDSDSSALGTPTNEEDLYVGPTYPVVKEDEDENTQAYFARPAPDKKPGKVKKG